MSNEALGVISIDAEENWVPFDSLEMSSDELSPEDRLIRQDVLQALSDEAKELVILIFNCPANYFLNNGKLKKLYFQEYCKQQKGWSKNKTELLKFELEMFLKYAFR